jgi:hypothetical protein
MTTLDSPRKRLALLPAHKKRERQLKHKKTFCGMTIAFLIIEGQE